MKMKYFEEPTATVVALGNDIVRTSEPTDPTPEQEKYELPIFM